MVSVLIPCKGGGETTQILMLYTCATRETHTKKGYMRFSVQMCLFSRERVLFGFYKGVSRGYLPVFSKNSCLGVKLWFKISHLGFFLSPEKGKSRLGYVFETYCHTCVQH